MTDITVDQLGKAAESLRRMAREHPHTVEHYMMRHGARIEAKAASITPVDRGFLRRATAYRVDGFYGVTRLTVENRLSYAVYQHDYPHRHSQPQARDHFISIPFAAEIPLLVRDIIEADIKEATQ